MNILGLNAYHGDAAAALLSDGSLVAAIEEERLNRIKHWAGFPALSIQACLAGHEEPEHVAISRDPRAHFWRKLARVAVRPAYWPRALSRAANGVSALNGASHGDAQVHHVEHHRAHLASAFFPSPFEEAAVASIDGFGDFSSVMYGAGRGSHIDVLGSVQFPHSLGIFYTAFTQFLGFPRYGDEYKMMGLAAYGEPRFLPQVREIVKIVDGAVTLNLDYFTHHTRGVDMTWKGGEPVIGPIFSARMAEAFGSACERADVAASVQAVLEENYFALLRHVHRMTGQKRLCLAGGVALNCVANGKIFAETPFQEVYIQPAAHDAGTSIGAALHVWHQLLGKPRAFVMDHVYYGPDCDETEARRELEAARVAYRTLDEAQLIECVAQQIAGGKIVGWFQGRMEFGPRALGNRSILADPRRKDMKDVLNSRIKNREPFRPFCPSVLAEATEEYFETSHPSPFMVMAYRVKPSMRDRIPAVTHADGTGRLQTVHKDVNPLYWKLIRRFGEITGVPVLLNTSFNENEPIVNTPRQAVECFLRTKMDALAIGPYLAVRAQ